MPRIREDFSHEQRMTVSVKEARAITGLGLNSLYKLINDGRLATTKIGQRRLVILASLKELINTPQVPVHHRYGRAPKTEPKLGEAV